MDDFVKKLPGSPRVKAFVTASVICAALAVPVFGGKEGRQGHDYMSQEKPEAVRQVEEKRAKLARQQEREQS